MLAPANHRTIIIMRVIVGDGSTTGFTKAQLSDAVLGRFRPGGADPVNLESQYRACSFNKLRFNPTTSNSIINGATNVNITMPPSKGDGFMCD